MVKLSVELEVAAIGPLIFKRCVGTQIEGLREKKGLSHCRNQLDGCGKVQEF